MCDLDAAVRRWLEFLAQHRLVRVYPGLEAARTALSPLGPGESGAGIPGNRGLSGLCASSSD